MPNAWPHDPNLPNVILRTMLPFLLVFVLLFPLQSVPKEIYKAPINDTYNLRITVDYSETAPRRCCESRLRLLLVDRANADRYWEIASIQEPYEYGYRIRRPDTSSVVIDREDSDYGTPQGSFKVFFDLASKRLLKQIEFKPIEALQRVPIEEATRVGLNPGWFAQVQNSLGRQRFSNQDQLPSAVKGQPLPQSTYSEFARTRPAKANSSFGERFEIEEQVGPYQEMGDRIWFGKTFYDGEGYSGVGAIGYFDKTQKQYAFLRIPEVVNVSISAILVEDGVLWAGMETRPEGESFSNGLLRYDLKTASARVYPIDDVIRTIHRSADALVMSTENGIYVLKADGRLTRHRVSPTIEGKFVFDSETLK